MKITLLLQGLDCANCAGKIEKAASKLDFISSVNMNFMMQKLIFEVAESDKDKAVAEVSKIVKKLEPDVNVRRV